MEAEETVTLPAGTFRTLRIARRNKATKEIRWEEWYAPDVKTWVRWRDRTTSGPRERRLTSDTPR